VVISASSGPIARGGSNHAIKSKVIDAAGVEPYDVAEFFKQELSCASYNVDQDKWWKFANNCEEAMNWLIDKMEAAGYETVLEMPNCDEANGPMMQHVGSHSWIGGDVTEAGAGQQFVVETLAQNAIDAGAQVIYNTVAKQLVREDDNTGRVTAVIAQAEDGSYTKYVGSKAIVLATGDFSTDKEMMAKYCDWAMPLLDDTGDQGYSTALKVGGLYPGDGQKMGLWIGAAWQKNTSNAPVILVGAGGAGLPSTQANGAHRGLLINKNGYRYGNEDNNGSTTAISMMHQPDMTAFGIWGTNYAADRAPWYQFGMIYGDDPIPPEEMIEKWELMVRVGQYVKGDTIEEVIEQLGLPLEETMATVERYNGFCEAGVDEDYHKQASLLVPIAEGPFYGGSYGKPTFLCVMGGLRTNVNMQVCDENDEPIPGLFNVGCMVGDMFANSYNFMIPGHSLGNCTTFGYLTGRGIADGTLE
jgi:succinate dehydrogenase/fumarate reductase flavoprotein subunit